MSDPSHINTTQRGKVDISVIIPTRNRKDLLMLAVQSVLQQTYQNLEIIIHDNNSSDGTEQELRSRFHDPRIRYYRVDKDLSMQQNWNAAFQYVTGTYFLRLDDDNCIYQDFLECALREIRQHRLHMVTFSALNVHLKNKLFRMFDDDQKIYILNEYQIAYLEYFCLTDSNCAVYDVSMLKQIFPDGNIYQADLPDRYLSYCIAGQMTMLRLKVGFSTMLKDVTRYDYRSYLPAGFQLQYVPYMSDRMRAQDPKSYSFNFALLRINTLKQFMEKTPYSNIQLFLQKKIMHKDAYRALAFWGHIMRVRYAYSVRELLVYVRSLLSITSCLLLHPWVAMEGERAGMFLLKFLVIMLRAVYTSFLLITRRQQRKPDEVHTALGDKIIDEVLHGYDLNRYRILSVHGSLPRLLADIDQRSRSLRYHTREPQKRAQPS